MAAEKPQSCDDRHNFICDLNLSHVSVFQCISGLIFIFFHDVNPPVLEFFATTAIITPERYFEKLF